MTREEYEARREEIVSDCLCQIDEHESAGDFGDAENARRGRPVAVSRMVGAEGAAACPFCGSTEVYVEEYEHHPGAMRWRVFCAGCMAGVDTGTRQSASSAVQDWNRRAERTCCVESSRTEWEDGEYSYLDVELSCGHAFTWDDGTPPDYCPYCGARVVSE